MPYEKKSMSKVVFHSSKSTGSISIFLKKCLELNLLKKRMFCKIFRSLRNFLELQCLVNDLHEVDMRLGNEKKKKKIVHNISIVFS